MPRAYLERFASGNQLLVRRRDSKAFLANPTNVAVECGFYDVNDASGASSSSVELALATLDGDAIEALRTIDRHGRPPERDSRERQVVATYLALQTTRTPEQRERVEFPARVAAYANGRELTEALVAEYLETTHLRSKPTEREVGAAYDFVSIALQDPSVSSHEFAIRMMLQSVVVMAPIIAGLNWTLEVDRKEQLITSDGPLVIWRTPSHRDTYEGVGVANADELRFPLDPGKQLVITKRQRTPTARVSAERARACSADLAGSCHRFVIGRPNQATLIRQIPLSPHRPVLRFNRGPLYEQSPSGLRKTDREILHTWVQRRA